MNAVIRSAWKLVLGAILALAAVSALAATPGDPAPGVELTIDDERPFRAESVRIHVSAGGVPAPGAVVEAIYRPNSSTTHREPLPPADSSGTIFWTPRDAGPVTLEARLPAALESPPATTLTVAVRYQGFPPSGLAIMVLAGCLLLGGAILGMIMLLTGPSEALPLDEPPSS